MDPPSIIDLAQLRARSRLGRKHADSVVELDTAVLWLETVADQKMLAIAARPDESLLARFVGVQHGFVSGHALKLCPANAENAASLRETLPWLRPVPLGTVMSAGMGDRLGLATPGHVRALRMVLDSAQGRRMAPIFAQQSIREMTRTGRTPLDVLTDATWGAFEAGWRAPLGADADHCKTAHDIDAMAAAGYTLYTIDPGEYVDCAVEHATPGEVQRKFEALPWADLESRPGDLMRRLAGKKVDLEDRKIEFSTDGVIRAAAKYGGAVAHVSRLYRHLMGKAMPFELEISVDETVLPTSHAEHIYIVSELRRLGVQWVSLAPRYVGRFEKGVDFIGNLDALAADLAGHASIARAFGPYKLSLHSGSDKFRVYPLIVEATNGAVHLKTAGTSYLEALRVTAHLDPDLFRAVLTFGCSHYADDRASYIVSGDPDRIPDPMDMQDEQLPELLDNFDVRQVLHVTFGSALAAFRPRLITILHSHDAAYSAAIERHFIRHLRPFLHPEGALTVDGKQ